MVTIREGGTERQVTAAEAFLLQLAKRGLEGDTMAARATITAIAEAKSVQITDLSIPTKIIINFVAPGSVNTALKPLRMAKKLDPYRETARMALEPWLVEAAACASGGSSSDSRGAADSCQSDLHTVEGQLAGLVGG